MENNRINQTTSPSPRIFDLDKKDTIFSVLICLSSVLFATLGLWGGFNVGFTISSLLNLILITSYLFNKKLKLKAYPLFCAILAFLSPFVFILTSNGSVKFWSFIAILCLSLVWFSSLVGEKSESGDLAIPKLISNSFINTLGNIPKSVVTLFSGENTHKKVVGNVFLGILLSIPVLIVVIPLLISSDVAFSGLTSKISEDFFNTIFEIIVGLLIAPFFLSYCLSLKKDERKEICKDKNGSVENAIIISFLSVISLCYLSYLFSQLAYFFSAFSGFLPKDYTFTVSEYARRGFFEMCIIAVINFILSFTVLLLSKKNNNKICIASRILCLFISFFTLIIIATALSKMILYIDSFGMTKLRITTSAFMIFLAIVFVSLILRLFIPKVNVLRVALATASCILIMLSVFNVNIIVAKYNYEAYKSGVLKTIDIETIYELNEEGVPYLVKLTNDIDTKISEEAHKKIIRVIEDKLYEIEYEGGIKLIKEKKYSNVEKYNIPRYEAYKALDKYIEEHPNLLNK